MLSAHMYDIFTQKQDARNEMKEKSSEWEWGDTQREEEEKQ